MIKIQQGFKLDNLNVTLAKCKTFSFGLNTSEIQSDIDRMQKNLDSIPNKRNCGFEYKNLHTIINYLTDLHKRSLRGTITTNAILDNGIIKFYPVEIMSYPEYDIYAADYIQLTNEVMIHVEYKQLADIIAFELMCRDLGETSDSIEDKLKDIGIIKIHNCEELTKYFEDSPYQLSKILRVGESPYLNSNKKMIYDYFGNVFKADRYYEVVRSSCRYAMSFVVESILSKIVPIGLKVHIASVDETGIYLVADKSVEQTITRIVSESVNVRSLGRQFEVQPSITVF